MHPNLVVRAAGWLAARGISPESAAGASSSRQVTPHLSDVDMRAIDGEMKTLTAAMITLARQDERIKEHERRISGLERQIG